MGVYPSPRLSCRRPAMEPYTVPTVVGSSSVNSKQVPLQRCGCQKRNVRCLGTCDLNPPRGRIRLSIATIRRHLQQMVGGWKRRKVKGDWPVCLVRFSAGRNMEKGGKRQATKWKSRNTVASPSWLPQLRASAAAIPFIHWTALGGRSGQGEKC